MGHNHSHHSHHHGHNHSSTKNIKAAFFLNLSFTVFEIIGGFWTNSMAILSDAVHDLGDSLSLGLSWYLDKTSKQKGDKRFSFGYQRFSLLGALINGVVLIGGSIYIFTETIPRLFNPEPANAKGMVIFAIAGIAINGAAVLRLKGGKSMNEQVVSWHLLEDVLGWVAVLIVSIVLLFWDFYILDPILSILILCYVLFNVVRNLRETLVLFLQGVPRDIDLDELQDKIKALDKVVSIHHTHVWSLEGEHHVLTIHIVISEVASVKEIINLKHHVKKLLREVPIEHATIEMEFEDESCYMGDPEDNKSS